MGPLPAGQAGAAPAGAGPLPDARGLPEISARDIAIGHPLGTVSAAALPNDIDPDPVRALRDTLRRGLLRPPCVVAFSGGRDSSLLLAVAADVAARDGLAAPIALSFRYPGDRAADESAWQELVIAQLGARGLPVEWVRRDIADELDIIGPLAAPVLRAHGSPTFPAGIGNTIMLARYARGGCLVTGNAGDEVLGGHRMVVLRTVLRAMLTRRARGMTGADWRLAATCAAPARARAWWARRTVAGYGWLRPHVRRAVVAEVTRAEAARPLRWDRSVRFAVAPRAVAIGRATRDHIARGHDCVLHEPLGSVEFVASYAAFGGRWGGLGRAAGTRLLAGGLLPEALLGRRDKARFNASRFGPVARQFARAWDGGGVDHDLVDPVALRAAWLAEVPPAPTGMLLQQAWLAGRATDRWRDDDRS